MKLDFEKSLWTGVFVAVASVVTGFLAGLFKQSIQTAFATVPLTSGITAAPGEKLLSFVSGLIGTNIASLPILIFTSFLLAFVGFLLYDLLGLEKIFKGDVLKLMAVLSLGTILAYVILVGPVVPSTMAFIGMWIYYLVTGFIALAIAGLFHKKIV